MNKEQIFNKIESLGERKRSKNERQTSNWHVNRNEYSFPILYFELNDKFGSFSYEKWIKIKSIDAIPVSDNEYVTVEGFYFFEDAIQLFFEYKDQIPADLIPITDGEPGDLICIRTEGAKSGKIYYWHHESAPNQNVYLLANSLEEFIMNLEVFEEEEENSDQQITKVHLSEKFLDMLKKDGYGPVR